jgi:hypothetical protein
MTKIGFALASEELSGLEQACDLVTEEMAAKGKAYGPDPERYVQSINQFVDAGSTELYVQQIGPDQDGFLQFWNAEVAPRLGH